MGKKMTPSYANLFMDALEWDMFSSYHLAPLHSHRYIDDIFFIWIHEENSFWDLKKILHSFHYTIKFTFEYSTMSIPFLDVMVGINNKHISCLYFIKEISYYKQQDEYQTFLSWNSFCTGTINIRVCSGSFTARKGCCRLWQIIPQPPETSSQSMCFPICRHVWQKL